jgi:2-polyprenyl-3-methyl-5-hydroxy-6-metoxy-1,4-benzoquinol methylase
MVIPGKNECFTLKYRDNLMKANESITLCERSCAVCSSEEKIEGYDQPTENIAGIGDIGYHHIINICSDCGFVYASPILDENSILKYYENMSNYEFPQSIGVRPVEDIRQIDRQIEIIKSRFAPGFVGSALDVGCSIAYGLSVLKKQSWKVVGIDPSDACIRVSKDELDVPVLKGFFSPEAVRSEQPFDVIILSHVVEHLVHPEEQLKLLFDALSDDGIIYIEVPDLMKPTGIKCYFGFEHVNFFTTNSLTNLIRRSGFEVDHVQTFENGKAINPFFPVIAMTIKKSVRIGEIESDREAAERVIGAYKNESEGLIKKINARIDAVVANVAPGRLSLWGAGIHTSQILSESSIQANQIHCIFDSDAKKAGGKINGIEIKAFPSDAREAAKQIDAILISSEASEDAIYDQIKYVEDAGIKLFKLYS